MVHDTYAPDDLAPGLEFVFEAALDGVGGVAYDHAALGNLVAAAHATDLALIVELKTVSVGVEHEGAAVQCG